MPALFLPGRFSDRAFFLAFVLVNKSQFKGSAILPNGILVS